MGWLLSKTGGGLACLLLLLLLLLGGEGGGEGSKEYVAEASVECRQPLALLLSCSMEMAWTMSGARTRRSWMPPLAYKMPSGSGSGAGREASVV